MKDLALLQKKYRFSLGKDMCKKYNLKAGDILQMKETPDGILLTPVKVVPKSDFNPQEYGMTVSEFVKGMKEVAEKQEKASGSSD